MTKKKRAIGKNKASRKHAKTVQKICISATKKKKQMRTLFSFSLCMRFVGETVTVRLKLSRRQERIRIVTFSLRFFRLKRLSFRVHVVPFYDSSMLQRTVSRWFLLSEVEREDHFRFGPERISFRSFSRIHTHTSYTPVLYLRTRTIETIRVSRLLSLGSLCAT